MKSTKVLFFSLLLAAMTTVPQGAMSQVTIGADQPPQEFSVLELISNNSNALRLPQLTTDERDAITTQPFKDNILARGLTIYNTSAECVQYWNGDKWIGAGCPPIPPIPAIVSTQNVCPDGTVADLLPSGLKWYAAATGGMALASTTALNTLPTTLYASQTVSGMESDLRTPVIITFVGSCATLPDLAYKIFSPVSVMYNYQYQDLELYKSTGTGDATSYQWYVRSKEQPTASNVAIPAANGGTAKIFTVPSNFPETAQIWSSNDLKTLLGSVSKNDTLIFTCEYTNPNTAQLRKDSTEIEFLYLDENNYVMLGTVKYYFVEIDIASSGTVKILATNLGVETANAADLGDLYQWGRGGIADQTPDGHEHIVWGHTISILWKVGFADVGLANGTSGIHLYNASEPIDPLAAGSEFIYNNSKWVETSNAPAWTATDLNNLWTENTATEEGYNPCPADWHIPTNTEWSHIATIGNTFGADPVAYADVNDWKLPSAGFGNDAHIGGYIIAQNNATPNLAHRVFMPVTGFRSFGGGTLAVIGTSGYYWSSSGAGYSSFFTSGNATLGNNFSDYSHGFSVRCISD
jgi:uncharacterized protein (TIGR02145 family)